MQHERSDSSLTRPKWWAPPGFLLGLVLVLGGLYALGKQHYADQDVREDRQKLHELDEARYVVVGASHGEGVELERVGIEGQNFSHGGQDLFEMVYIARSAVQQAPELETVIIVLSYFSFALDNAAYERRGVNNRIGRRVEMYSAFPRWAFIPGDHAEYAKGLLYPIVTRDHFQHGFERTGRRLLGLLGEGGHRGKRPHARPTDGDATWRAEPEASAEGPREPAPDDADDERDDPDLADEGAAGPEPELPSAAESADGESEAAKTTEPKAARRPSGKPHTVKNEAWYARHAAGRCRFYFGLMDNMRAHHPNLERDTYRTLQRLVADLTAKHIAVVLLSPPYLPAYSNCFDARMQRVTQANATRLAQTPGVRYIDLTRDPTFTTNLGLFVDSDHLRANGKELLANKLAGLLHLGQP